MKLKFLISSSFNTIAVHKVRSFLTMLGIMIGVTAIIAVMSIGQGATGLIMSEIDIMGANTVSVAPGTMESGFVDFFFVEPLTQNDLDALLRPANVPNLSDIMAGVIVPDPVSYGGQVYRDAMTMGGNAEFFTDTFNMVPERGVNFSSVDINNNERVAVIGSRVKEELFGMNEAVGERIMIGNVRFLVLGVYASRGYVGPIDMDNFILIPHTTAQAYILGNYHYDEFYIKIDSPENVDRAVADIKATLRESRNIQPGEDDDFTVMTQESMQKMVGDVMNILNAFLIFVVSIALLVGGIGIMNIMLVSVTERTKEIGLRKALGATNRAILRQFLWESVTLTVIGGVIGIIFGALISFVVSETLTRTQPFDWEFIFPIEAAVLGVGMSALVGLIFGLYPARKAARKDPVEALQYEK